MPVVTTTQEQPQILSLEARGYWMLSVMRAVMMMPNSTVSTRLLSSDHVGGELQLIFPVSQEDFNNLLSGELEVGVRPIEVPEVVHSGVQDDELKYSDGQVGISKFTKEVEINISDVIGRSRDRGVVDRYQIVGNRGQVVGTQSTIVIPSTVSTPSIPLRSSAPSSASESSSSMIDRDQRRRDANVVGYDLRTRRRSSSLTSYSPDDCFEGTGVQLLFPVAPNQHLFIGVHPSPQDR
ncbi:hypothetical protein BDM02DRAFT_3192423 [Thelephora ganbajun]|uniref:Uncharacterized protein n=1 Tax=Thelephora ganbajun TaxID=370292 RepID=A0ACB6YZV8_THEGA|nr:hypothetical protein BDM02DRAFT_3192423 [Thelephora ganbajun]